MRRIGLELAAELRHVHAQIGEFVFTSIQGEHSTALFEWSMHGKQKDLGQQP